MEAGLESRHDLGQAQSNKRYQLVRRTANDATTAAEGIPVTEDTQLRVAAAKSYIENMYKVQYHNIQERYSRHPATNLMK
ncbi:uncharacterized protein HaLaN_28153 [Haematococcus lacustris]|uniref:Uncharacterized protein n=1 Tax=Haematococcus lacustris TaxID=44745 RepID=A0A6A0ACC3_HAELA|nr:uncharacterized protein HaLaN_28153 [Haematococcus lacustris]